MTKLPEPQWDADIPVFTITEVGEEKGATVEISSVTSIPEPVVVMTEVEAPLVDQQGRHQSSLRSIELAYHRLMSEIGAPSRLEYPDGIGELSPEDEKVVEHALAILPHIGATATATYLVSAVPLGR